MRRAKNWLIYHVCHGIWGLAGHLPPWVALSLGRGLGHLAFWLDRGDRRLMEEHLLAAMGPGMSDERRRETARGVFLHLGVSLAELVALDRLLIERKSFVTMSPGSREALEGALAQGEGVVYVTGHRGNWELMARWLAGVGYPIFTLAKGSYDPRFTALIDRWRSSGGVTTIWRDDPNSLRRLAEARRVGGVLGFLIDQDTAVAGTFVDFFGIPAYTPLGAASMAVKRRMPVVVGHLTRLASGDHTLHITRVALPDTGDHGLDAQELTGRLTGMLEEAIRACPEQWVWMHRRWKTRP